MASDRKKLVLFKDGPEKGRKMEWEMDGGPPPVSIFVIDKNTYAVYHRSDIEPHSHEIRYYYEFEKKSAREEAEKDSIRKRSEGWG